MSETAKQLQQQLDQAQTDLRDLEADLPKIKKLRDAARHAARKSTTKGDPADRAKVHERLAGLESLHNQQERHIAEAAARAADLERQHEARAHREHQHAVWSTAQAESAAAIEQLIAAHASVLDARGGLTRIRDALQEAGIILEKLPGQYFLQGEFRDAADPPAFYEPNIGPSRRFLKNAARTHPDLVRRHGYRLDDNQQLARAPE